MEKIISLAKQRGFIYQGSEIYGGLAGTFDYGPLGVALKKNIENIWWKKFVSDKECMYGVDASILMNPEVWKASGHVDSFSDPLVECKNCKRRFRADHIGDKCPECGGQLGEVKQFNMMFKTNNDIYLRPETAQGMFVNFKNIIDSFHPKLPFGMAQIGKAFRNEIAPRDFIFRVRELEQMEIEYFVKEENWREVFEAFQKEQLDFLLSLGLNKSKIHQVEIKPEDRAHYSKHSVDTEFDFPIGQKELLGLAYRTDYDLKNHSAATGVDLSYFDEETKSRYTPHCIEPTFGLGRLMLAVLCDAYTEDELGGEPRTYLKFAKNVAPIKIAVFPLLKNKPVLVEKAREVYKDLKKEFGAVVFDDNGNIGKRYRRQDEIGTPYCVTVDFETLEDETITIRDRDSAKQNRINIKDLNEFFQKNFS